MAVTSRNREEAKGEARGSSSSTSSNNNNNNVVFLYNYCFDDIDINMK